MFTNRDIADYYNQTLNHYRRWWKLDKVMSVHYGYWDHSTRNFQEALLRLNDIMADMVQMETGFKVLDAGCGVGGSLFYLAEEYGINGFGITLSEKQLEFAEKLKSKSNFADSIGFKLEDYCSTSFPDNTFDVVWCIESITSTAEKEKFAREAYRLLKKHGKLIIADYYKISDHELLEKWRKTWSMAPFVNSKEFEKIIKSAGFVLIDDRNITGNIYPTSLKMYRASLLGALPSMLYNLTHKTSRFAKTHYLSGVYQYKALKKGLWEYKIHLFEK